MRPVVFDDNLKFRDPSLNRSREIPLEVVGGGIFDSCFCYNFRPDIGNDVLSSVAVDYVRMDVPAKIGDSKSNGFQDIREADFVSNE